jgi:predicted heme/steroid binding protein
MKVLSNLSLYGTLGLNSVVDANTDTDKFLVIDSSGIVKYRTGQELYNDIGAGGAASYTSTLQHEVKAGVALTKGQAVYVTSADGTNMIVSKASNASEATSSKTLGLIAQDLSINGKGFVITEGLLSGLNTMAAGTEGDPVWLGTDGNLIYGLGSKPYAPAHLVFIGIVTRRSANNGEIFVKVQNGFELDELHNVQITSTPSDNAVLAYETSTSLYKMKSISTLLGYTPTTNARTLTINGTSYDLSADRSWSVGTHTGNLTTGYVPKATGATTLTDSLIYDNGSAIGINTNAPYESSAFKLDVDGGVLIKNTKGVAAQLILINSNPATGGNNGFVQLSAGGNTATAFGQWQTYYGMSVASGALRLQPAGGQVLIGTTTTSAFTTDINGTLRVSGQLTLGSTISNNTYVYTMPGASGTLALVSDIPSLSGYVPTSRTLTINGTSYDLSADRSWTIAAGVSSVQAGSGISVSTSSGVVTVVNTGLLSGTAGSGISVSTSGQNLNIVNTGLLSGTAGSGISVSTSGQNLNIVNTGLLSATAGSGISVSTSSQNVNIVNTGLLSATAGTGISVSTTSGTLNIVNTITNTNQLTNGAGYITGITSGMVTTALGYTPYNSSNPSGYITGYTETDTLSSVTGRGATTSSPITINGGGSQPLTLTTASGSPWHLALVRNDLGLTSRVFAHNSPYNGWYFEHNISIAGNTNWHSGNLTNLNQLSNGPGYITGYTETDTLASVTARGNTTNSSMAIGSGSIPNGRLYVNSGSASDVIALQNSLNTGAYLVFADNITPTWANAPRLGAISNDMVFKTLDTTRLTIASTGAATFSSSVTTGLLIAQGPGGNYNENVRLPGSTAVISFNTSGATGAGSYNIVSQTTFQIRNAGGTQVFIMDQSGNLAMTGHVDVYTSSGADYLRLTDNQVYRPGAGPLYLNWSSNGNVYATGPAGGNMGVGNNSPSYKLHVSGDIYANGGWLRVSGTSGVYFESYGGGWHMTDSSYVKIYNGKSVNMLGNSVDYVGSIYMNGGVYIQTNNNRNLQVKSSGAADCGILGRGNGDQFAFQVYGNGTGDYGFLNGVWAAWDLRKTANGALYMNDNTGYYLQTNSNSYLSRLHVADASSGVAMHVGVGSTHGVYTLDNDRKYLVVSGEYYPHMALVARSANNTNHGAVFSFVGSEGGAFRQWNLGISNNNPFLFSIGYNRTTDPNPHYGIGDGWSSSDVDHARLSIDRDGNTKIRGMLYVNGTSGGISVGNAVIHAGNIGSQSVSYANSAGSASSATNSTYLFTHDLRTISPSSHDSYRLRFGFTSWANNSSAPYADYLHLRSYSDSSGGADNLIMFLKSGIGMRIWQQSFGSGTAYSSYVDVLHSSNYSSYALPLSGGELSGPLYVGTIGSGVYTTHWKDGGGSYMEVIGNSTATRKLRIQAFNGSSSYAQWYMDGGNMQIYGDVAGVRNFLIDSTTAYLRWGGADRLWGGSDGTRNSGWAYHNNNDTGLHWPNNGWHFYPKDVNDMYMRSGSATNVAIAMNTAGTTRGYVYAENDNTIGFLTNGRGWAFRTYSNGDARVYGYLYVNGGGTASSIYMSDTDEGQREIHCNSNRIGFLTQSGAWGAWCTDDGSWESAVSVTTNDWFYVNGGGGLYWSSYGRGLRSPDAEGNPYGNVNTYGSGRNGWLGYGIGSQFTFMGRTSVDVGLHDTSFGWIWYSPFATGRMGIGTSTTSSSYRLYVEGAIYATGDVVAYSDRRKKKNIETIGNAIEKVTSLRGVFYDKIGEEEKGRQLGVIAQEVDEVLPEAVSYAKDIDEYGVKYGNLGGLFIEAFKEQQRQIEELKSIINGLTK